ncbi:MAG: amidohydrolase family protein [Acidimicrobiia bacterium]
MATGDLLVRGGTVVDGTGIRPFAADVRVRGGRIVEVAAGLAAVDGETTFDATGAYVTPGFLETHTHYDPAMFWDPSFDPMPQHGVTTVTFGNCGLSLAPIRTADVGRVSDVFCYIEDMSVATFATAIPWSWETYGEYLDAIAEKSFAVNTSGLIGHSVIRQYVIGNEAWDRPSTPEETVQIVAVLEAALDAGAYGLSTSLGFDTDRDKRLVPSRVADDAEFRALFEVLARRKRIVQFIPSPIPKYLVRDVQRMADVSRGLDLVQTWINVYYNARRPEEAVGYLEMAARLQAEGIRSIPQVSPRGFDMEVNWFGGMSFYTMDDTWHRVLQADADGKRELLTDPQWRARAREQWDATPFTMIQHRHPQNIVFTSLAPQNAAWEGRTFAEMIEERGEHPSDVLADLLLENDLAPGIVARDVANGDPDGVSELLRHPAGVLSNSDAGAHVQMMCAEGDTTLLLTRHVRDRGDISIEEAIHRMTGHQASIFGYHDRGTIEVGKAGDLVVFALDELSYAAPVSISDLPDGGRRQRRPAGGYRATFVGGVATQVDGELTGALPGRLLRP